MLTTATHATKRGEDVRARLVVLSELVEEWTDAVRRWSMAAEVHRDQVVDRNLEYLWWQTLVGAHPLDPARALAYMQKAAREAKEITSWTEPDESYEAGVERFGAGVLGDEALMADVDAFVDRIDQPARTVSLAVSLLRITSPGVPDTYQGTELWEHSLVDPDNRRPVDFDRRAQLLEVALLKPAAELWAECDDAAAKLRVLATALAVRRRHTDALVGGSYQPLGIEGTEAHRVFAFVRGSDVAVVVPRLTAKLAGWGDTTVLLPAGEWHEQLTGQRVRGTVALTELLATFPVALLEREPDSEELR
jgi:(1->4)-alpha-D-glucan 1-alpha-D-glucosylmutase